MTSDLILGNNSFGILSAAECITPAPCEYPTRAKVWSGHDSLWETRRLTTSREPRIVPEMIEELAGYYKALDVKKSWQ